MPIANPWIPLSNAIVTKITEAPEFISMNTRIKAIMEVEIRFRKLAHKYLLERDAFLMDCGKNL